MNKDEAKILLSYHSCRNDDIYNDKWTTGFLGSLRPFTGQLYEENFIEIMECLKILKDEFEEVRIDKNIVTDIFTITYYTRAWCRPDNMLGRNHLLTLKQEKELQDWIDIIEDTFSNLLDLSGEPFWSYEEYTKGISP